MIRKFSTTNSTTQLLTPEEQLRLGTLATQAQQSDVSNLQYTYTRSMDALDCHREHHIITALGDGDYEDLYVLQPSDNDCSIDGEWMCLCEQWRTVAMVVSGCKIKTFIMIAVIILYIYNGYHGHKQYYRIYLIYYA